MDFRPEGIILNSRQGRTNKCTRVADRAFPEVKVSWRQPGDFTLYASRIHK